MNNFFLSMNSYYFKHGILIGCIFGGSFTYIITTLYIDKYYILIPNKMSSFHRYIAKIQ
jgi:hypothetical protein